MSNKTTLQELIEDIESLKAESMNPDNVRPGAYRIALKHMETKITHLLEKEKQQIMEAFKKGVTSCYDFKTPEQYFNSNYGNPQGDPEETE
ncbi:hypothetical protein [Elizabethkingia ursingii]|uniref:Uncharacterized protein n=1 Tax=Elizabethkingia ursingii TaxID=1756150 RepID=A0AAJ3TP36_9FLAO|nr:hypothetical protein [Elizabethkingia ursingii]AQX09834.1 hypothetical protein BBD34_14855 [Elizabethkingia ursingii]KUY29865.1 hypothetical protein ATB96_17450 [Elizabethkingia ursingii]OPB75977.1 hypothetical protein BAY32_04225 [Elizabethkingia ursingii]OPB84644.1 hypothetical protein BB021_14905 [Elizabethkingia ursingii]